MLNQIFIIFVDKKSSQVQHKPDPCREIASLVEIIKICYINKSVPRNFDVYLICLYGTNFDKIK